MSHNLRDTDAIPTLGTQSLTSATAQSSALVRQPSLLSKPPRRDSSTTIKQADQNRERERLAEGQDAGDGTKNTSYGPARATPPSSAQSPAANSAIDPLSQVSDTTLLQVSQDNLAAPARHACLALGIQSHVQARTNEAFPCSTFSCEHTPITRFRSDSATRRDQKAHFICLRGSPSRAQTPP